MPITLNDIQDGEVIHQRCLLISGKDSKLSDGDDAHVVVESTDMAGKTTFPDQRWPMCQGHFKGLILLAPGENTITISNGQHKSTKVSVRIQYTPLLQTPPLHLAIMVAKDSPLLIDCPPAKFGALSTAHSNLNAAIAKLRVAAYMWQALTAEEMRLNGLGRRAFRLEEEWTTDTLSRQFIEQQRFRSTAKVHLVRCEETVTELRDARLAQQNHKGTEREGLHAIFTKALLAHGSPFVPEARPVVAGMILDSHYDASAKLILGHAALGAHAPKGLSLGIFGSHLTYSWPRFMEEIPDCLLDVVPPGESVGNDNGECGSMWEACAVGQGAFLHEVGHAFSAPHSSGIMMRGYSPDWAKYFLSKTAFCTSQQTEGVKPVTPDLEHECHWDVRDLLRFNGLPHFRHPSDAAQSDQPPKLAHELDEDFTQVIVSCEAGIARISFNDEAEATPSIRNPQKSVKFTLAELEGRFNRWKPLMVEIFGMNGKHHKENLWEFFSNRSFIPVPGTNIRLQKMSIVAESEDDEDWHWAVMLKKRDRDGSLVPATKVDIRVGCMLDGAIVYYQDGTAIPCGPRGRGGKDPEMGGHQSKRIALPKGVDIAKVAVSKSWSLTGLRIWLSNGRAMGALNKESSEGVHMLVPDKGQRIIGFYGTSGGHRMCKEFGIVTAPVDQDLPDSVYDMPELQNDPNGGVEGFTKRRRIDESQTMDEDEITEDEDWGYDDGGDYKEYDSN